MANPLRDLPRVINTAMTVAISGFVLLNVSLYAVLPFQEIRERTVVAVVCCPPSSYLYFSPKGQTLTSHLGFRLAIVWTYRRLCLFNSRLYLLLGSSQCQHLRNR